MLCVKALYTGCLLQHCVLFAAPSGNLASQDRRLGIWIGVPVAAGLLLLVFLILYCLRKAKNSRSLTAGGGACAEIPGTQIPLGKWGGAFAGGGGGAEGSRSRRGVGCFAGSRCDCGNCLPEDRAGGSLQPPSRKHDLLFVMFTRLLLFLLCHFSLSKMKK